ncbi:MAG TPA: dihydrolipoyl dehydrogenase, partial [Thermoanaerobaculia bacterium]|nr:dihydrolipoyl dehydrogenase [Thermoanaerobaculia bacterium]
MVVGEVASFSEVLVIGGGPGGYAAALRAAGHGRQVTLVEADRIGGVCLNVGCIPSKVLIHAAEIAGLCGEAAAAGVDLVARPNLPRIRARMEDAVSRLTGGVEQLLAHAKVERMRGRARFVRENRVAVVDGDQIRHVEFEQAIVATGSRPAALQALPFDGVRVLDSTAALALEKVPETLAIVGGGYIGVELGTAFAKLGAEVTIVEALDRLLPQMEAALGHAVKRRLEELGVRVLLRARAEELTEQSLLVQLAPDSDSGSRPELADRLEVAAEAILVATGRLPNTADLGLEVMGVVLDAGGRVVVDPARRAARRVLAVGDVTAGPALAHKAIAEAGVAAATAAGKRAAFDPAAIPQIVFCDPEIASVGMTRDQAEAEVGDDVKSFRFPLAASGRAQTIGPAVPGHVEIVADPTGVVLGVHLAGPRVSELAGEAALAIEMGATLEDLALTIHPHPTFSEALAESAWGA